MPGNADNEQSTGKERPRGNPFDEDSSPDLRAAWEEGWKAYQNGAPIPDRNVGSEAKEASAWLDGYAAWQAEK